MPTTSPTKRRPPIPAGDHVLTLTNVEMIETPGFRDPQVMVNRMLWTFKARLKDHETGEPYEFRVYTGYEYGDPRSGLNMLLDMMLPDGTRQQKQHFDTDTILNQNFRAKIRHEPGKEADDPPKPRLVYIEPVNAKPGAGRKTAVPVNMDALDGESDPFADE